MFGSLFMIWVSEFLDGGVVSCRNLISSDGNVQHVVVLSPGCTDAFMMLSINLHLQKAVSLGMCITAVLTNQFW